MPYQLFTQLEKMKLGPWCSTKMTTYSSSLWLPPPTSGPTTSASQWSLCSRSKRWQERLSLPFPAQMRLELLSRSLNASSYCNKNTIPSRALSTRGQMTNWDWIASPEPMTLPTLNAKSALMTLSRSLCFNSDQSNHSLSGNSRAKSFSASIKSDSLVRLSLLSITQTSFMNLIRRWLMAMMKMMLMK